MKYVTVDHTCLASRTLGVRSGVFTRLSVSRSSNAGTGFLSGRGTCFLSGRGFDGGGGAGRRGLLSFAATNEGAASLLGLAF